MVCFLVLLSSNFLKKYPLTQFGMRSIPIWKKIMNPKFLAKLILLHFRPFTSKVCQKNYKAAPSVPILGPLGPKISNPPPEGILDIQTPSLRFLTEFEKVVGR